MKQILIDFNKIAREIGKIKGVLGVYLFGSFVKGENYRDIDICVIGNLERKEKNIIERMGSEKIDISFFEELPLYIKFEVIKNGKKIVIKNNKIMEKIIKKTLWEYLDFRYLINKHIKENFKHV